MNISLLTVQFKFSPLTIVSLPSVKIAGISLTSIVIVRMIIITTSVKGVCLLKSVPHKLLIQRITMQLLPGILMSMHKSQGLHV